MSVKQKHLKYYFGYFLKDEWITEKFIKYYGTPHFTRIDPPIPIELLDSSSAETGNKKPGYRQ